MIPKLSLKLSVLVYASEKMRIQKKENQAHKLAKSILQR